MSWELLIKILAPIGVAAGIYFYGHHVGYDARDALVTAEIESAVSLAVGGERDTCTKELVKNGRITDEISKGKNIAVNLYADAIGKLYDKTHDSSGSAGPSTAAGINHEAAGPGRLYYADPAGAVPAIERSRIATDQAYELIGCQAYVLSLPGVKQPNAEP